MRRRCHDWRSERDSRNWLAVLVQTFDDVAESHASAKTVPTPEELRAQLLRPGAAEAASEGGATDRELSEPADLRLRTRSRNGRATTRRPS